MSKLTDSICEFAAPVARQLSLELWDVRFESEAGEKYLRFFIDKPDGVDIEDCERFHRAIDPVLDEHDPIDSAYMLEVSSPGIERELRRPEHFEAFTGSEVTVKLFKGIDGRKKLRGVLLSADSENLTIDIDGAPLTLTRSGISRVNLYEPIIF